MTALQILIGALFDAISIESDDDKYMDAVSLACFGLFPNIATIIMLLAAGAKHFLSVEGRIFGFPGVKALWLAMMVLTIIFLMTSRARILPADRIRFRNSSRRTAFLVSYYSLSYIATVGMIFVYGAAG